VPAGCRTRSKVTSTDFAPFGHGHGERVGIHIVALPGQPVFGRPVTRNLGLFADRPNGAVLSPGSATMWIPTRFAVTCPKGRSRWK